MDSSCDSSHGQHHKIRNALCVAMKPWATACSFSDGHTHEKYRPNPLILVGTADYLMCMVASRQTMLGDRRVKLLNQVVPLPDSYVRGEKNHY